MLLRSPDVTKPNARPQAPVIQVTALYEDLEAGVRVKALLDQAIR